MSTEASHRRPIIVQKYGGSSVADVAKIGRVADKVVAAHQAGNDVVVVVSAMGKTTDGLIALAREAARCPYNPDGDANPPRRELDMLLSTGERVSISLLSIAIQARGLDAISFTGSQSGILTNDRHFDARIIEVRPHRIEDELARGRIVIVAGYQGMSYRREITTLGRGGTDTTAVALAAALRAERCEIYSDVDGVYSADPRVVPDARHIPNLDHALLQEMAESGAKVVCAQAVEWARRAGITIHARSTFDDTRQTVVRVFGSDEICRARAVASEANVVLGLLPGGIEPSTLLLRAGDEAHVAIKDLNSTSLGTTFTISLLNVPDWANAKRQLTACLPALTFHEELARVSVVGDGLVATNEPTLRFCAALREAKALPHCLGASALRLDAVIDTARSDEAVRALHAAFVARSDGE